MGPDGDVVHSPYVSNSFLFPFYHSRDHMPFICNSLRKCLFSLVSHTEVSGRYLFQNLKPGDTCSDLGCHLCMPGSALSPPPICGMHIRLELEVRPSQDCTPFLHATLHERICLPSLADSGCSRACRCESTTTLAMSPLSLRTVALVPLTILATKSVSPLRAYRSRSSQPLHCTGLLW